MFSVLILTIGFSALSTNLSISALATIRVKKDIRITDIMTSASASSASSNWEDYNVSNINSTFCGCYNLTTLNVSTWNVKNVNEMFYAFANCYNLTTLNLSN